MAVGELPLDGAELETVATVWRTAATPSPLLQLQHTAPSYEPIAAAAGSGISGGPDPHCGPAAALVDGLQLRLAAAWQHVDVLKGRLYSEETARQASGLLAALLTAVVALQPGSWERSEQLRGLLRGGMAPLGMHIDPEREREPPQTQVRSLEAATEAAWAGIVPPRPRSPFEGAALEPLLELLHDVVGLIRDATFEDRQARATRMPGGGSNGGGGRSGGGVYGGGGKGSYGGPGPDALRKAFFSAGIMPLLLAAVVVLPSDVCSGALEKAVQAFTNVCFHPAAVAIVWEQLGAVAVDVLVSRMRRDCHTAELCIKIPRALDTLCYERDEARRLCVSNGCVEVCAAALSRHAADPFLQCKVLELLAKLLLASGGSCEGAARAARCPELDSALRRIAAVEPLGLGGGGSDQHHRSHRSRERNAELARSLMRSVLGEQQSRPRHLPFNRAYGTMPAQQPPQLPLQHFGDGAGIGTSLVSMPELSFAAFPFSGAPGWTPQREAAPLSYSSPDGYAAASRQHQQLQPPLPQHLMGTRLDFGSSPASPYGAATPVGVASFGPSLWMGEPSPGQHQQPPWAPASGGYTCYPPQQPQMLFGAAFAGSPMHVSQQQPQPLSLPQAAGTTSKEAPAASTASGRPPATVPLFGAIGIGSAGGSSSVRLGASVGLVQASPAPFVGEAAATPVSMMAALETPPPPAAHLVPLTRSTGARVELAADPARGGTRAAHVAKGGWGTELLMTPGLSPLDWSSPSAATASPADGCSLWSSTLPSLRLAALESFPTTSTKAATGSEEGGLIGDWQWLRNMS